MTIIRKTLDEIRAEKTAGKLYRHDNQPEAEDLPDEFWQNAKVVLRPKTIAVSLRLPESLVEAYRNAAGGKGHISLMQAVLESFIKSKPAEKTYRMARQVKTKDALKPKTIAVGLRLPENVVEAYRGAVVGRGHIILMQSILDYYIQETNKK